jgi:electron transfer flavoprotein alpha/beta subunit
MHIIVCIKQVPDTTEVSIDPQRGTLIREGVPSILNPFDTYAIEEGLLLKEKHGGRISVLSMGPAQAEEILKEAIAMGCDEGVLLSDPAFAGADTWATAYALAQAIRRMDPFDLILCGRQATDGDTGQVGPGIARQLGITQLTYVFSIREVGFQERSIRVERLLEEGREIVEAPLPALLTVLKGINRPRSPTFMGMRRARRAQVPMWSASDLVQGGAEAEYFGLEGSPTRVVKVFTPPQREGHAEIIEAVDMVQGAGVLAERLMAEKVI